MPSENSDADLFVRKTRDSLAKTLDLTGDHPPNHANIKPAAVNNALILLQSSPDSERLRILAAFLAVYLPKLYNAWLDYDEVRTAFSEVLNFASDSVYFARFSKLPESRAFAATQIRRIAQTTLGAATADPEQIEDDIGGICQFASTLLVYQGAQDVDPSDKAKALTKLQRWRTQYKGKFAGETSDRVYLALVGDQTLSAMSEMIKQRLEGGLYECGKQGCNRTEQPDGGDLKQCGRCKSARFCSEEHQKAAWKQHKPLCYAPEY